jgi:hypothetical protein
VREGREKEIGKKEMKTGEREREREREGGREGGGIAQW